MQSLVIYQIKCKTCEATYIGKTERHLRARLREHNNANKPGAIQMHLKEHPSHEIDPFDAEIIGRASDDTKLQIKEWIYIKNRDPSLNKQFATKTGNFSRNLKKILIDHLVQWGFGPNINKKNPLQQYICTYRTSYTAYNCIITFYKY